MELINFLATDGVKLNGLLYKSKNNIDKKIIMSVHGMSSNCFNERDIKIPVKANEKGIDFFTFNNRGSELVKYIKKASDENSKVEIGGMSYEDVLESYDDIVGAIIKLKELGYEKIYLQGHSLGCTKIVYTYNELLEENEMGILNMIKGVILLSLVDVPMAVKVYLRENYHKYLEYAEEKEKSGKLYEMMPQEAFIHPISVKTFLRYARDNQKINFAQFGRDNELKQLNNIRVPLFMRWGNDNERILQDANELSAMVSNILENPIKDINYIDGANHSYEGKEEKLAEEIVDFISNL